MGVIPGHKPGFGLECAGIIHGVGSNVGNFEPGDRVMAFSYGCFATSIVTNVDLVVKMPEVLGFAEAATLPTSYVTAIHALVNAGGLTEGEVRTKRTPSCLPELTTASLCSFTRPAVV